MPRQPGADGYYIFGKGLCTTMNKENGGHRNKKSPVSERFWRNALKDLHRRILHCFYIQIFVLQEIGLILFTYLISLNMQQSALLLSHLLTISSQYQRFI